MGWRGLKWAHSLFAMGTVAFGNLWAQDVFITVDQLSTCGEKSGGLAQPGIGV